jgi:single-strand DNA-binding protein
MNSVQILGNLTRDPQIRATKTGRSVASFSVAVSRNFVSPSGEQREMTDYINVVAWGYLADAVGNQLHKGSRVFVEGRYSTRNYEAQDGTKRYVTEVNANMIAIPLGSARGPQQSQDMGYGDARGYQVSQDGFEQPNGYNRPAGNFSQFGAPKTDEDIPF